MSRSKRLVGVANAIPGSGAAYGGTSAPQIELLQALILLFLVLDVLTDCLLVPPHWPRNAGPRDCAYVRRRRGPGGLALLPLMKPTTCDTAYFGGIEIIMCT